MMSKDDVLRLVRPNILALEPYSTARDEYEGDAIEVCLDANESPFENGVNRYPDPHQADLKAQLSAIKGVAADQIFMGNGSDEAIDLIFRLFARPGEDSAISIAPTYGMYKVAAAINDVAVHEVQLGENFELPVAELLAAADESTKIMWLCSPNNPTGNSFAKSDILTLLDQFHGVVVVDEAYIDFSAGESYLSELANYPNLVVLQTLSKAWGMAGLRCGLAFAAAEIISLMNRVKYPYNINVLTQARVAKGLSEGIDREVAAIIEQRGVVIAQLGGLKAIERVFPTDANFVLVKVANGAADRLYDTLLEQSVLVRNRSRIKGCEQTLRITIGTAEENVRMIEVIKNFE